MRLSVVLGEWLDRPIDADLAVAVEADRLGYPEVWIGEMAKLDAPAWPPLVVARTRQIEPCLGPLAVTVRSPAQIALAVGHGRRDRPARRTSPSARRATSSPAGTGAPRAGAADRAGDGDRTSVRALLAGERVDGFRLRQPPDGATVTVAAFGPRAVGDRRRGRPDGAQHGDGRGRRRAWPPSHPNTAVWLAAAVDPTPEERRWLTLGYVGYLAAPGYGEMFADRRLRRARGVRPHPAPSPRSSPRASPTSCSTPSPSSAIEADGPRAASTPTPPPASPRSASSSPRSTPRPAAAPSRPWPPALPDPSVCCYPSVCCGASRQQTLGGSEHSDRRSEGGGVDGLAEEEAAERLVQLRGDLQVLGRDVGVALAALQHVGAVDAGAAGERERRVGDLGRPRRGVDAGQADPDARRHADAVAGHRRSHARPTSSWRNARAERSAASARASSICVYGLWASVFDENSGRLPSARATSSSSGPPADAQADRGDAGGEQREVREPASGTSSVGRAVRTAGSCGRAARRRRRPRSPATPCRAGPTCTTCRGT